MSRVWHGSCRVWCNAMSPATQNQKSVFVESGILLHAQGDLPGADACYAQAVDANAMDADALLLRGIVARETGDADAAIGWCERAMELRPASTRIVLNLGRALTSANRFDEAKRCFERALDGAPEDAGLWCGLSDVAFAAGEDVAAERHLQQARRLKPQCWHRYRDEIRVLLQQRRYPNAVHAAQRALRAFPEECELYLEAAMAASLSGDHEQAVELCQTAVLLSPKNPDVYLALGHAFTVKGDLTAALQQYEWARQLHPRDTAIGRAIGETLFGLGRNQEALVCLRQCVAAELRVASSWYLLGRVLAHEGNAAEAESSYRRAVSLAPDEAKYKNAIGTLILFQRPREAVDLLREAVDLSPNWAVPHVNLGIGMMLLGNAPAMREHYRRAVVLEPDCAGAQYNLSLAPEHVLFYQGHAL